MTKKGEVKQRKIKLSKKDKNKIIAINETLKDLFMKLGLVTYKFHTEKKAIIDKITEIEKENKIFLNMIIDKYEIQGKIKNMDLEKGEIIIEENKE